MPDLLFEIGCEELPPNSILSLTNQIKENIISELKENNLSLNSNDVETYNTPRRIAIYIKNLPTKQELKIIEVKGPDKEKAFDKSGNPTQAAIGFAKKYSLEPKDLAIKKVNDSEYVFATAKTGGKEIKELLASILPSSIKKSSGEKFMSWGNYDEKFARPIRWILAILDKAVIKFKYANIESNNYTFGHKALGNKKIELTEAKSYSQELLKNFVIVNPSIRQQKIIDLINKETGSLNLIPANNPELLDEITAITEYPGLLCCEFEKDFLSLPECIIKTVLEKHQRYIVLYNKDNKEISSKFIVITNGLETLQKNKELVVKNTKKGNEKVVKARLNDAKFFYHEDLKRPFTYEERIKDLSSVTFQKGLGTMKEKTERITKFSEYIFEETNKKKKIDISKDEISTAAKLCKLDLTSRVVFELPELQGEIGAIYASKNNYSKNICTGISEHYKQCPKDAIGYIIGLADKLDNLICLFSIGKIPTGSTDPFALRRQSQGIINSILDIEGHKLNFEVNLIELINFYKENIPSTEIKQRLTSNIEKQIKDFILERFINLMDISYGYEKDVIHSVCSTGEALNNVFSTKNKIEELNKQFISPSSTNKEFLTAAKRLVRIVESTTNGNLDISLLKTEEEKALLRKIDELNNKQFNSCSNLFSELITLTKPINNFFDRVLVNDPDPKIKQARQALLKKGKDLFEKICDFNKITERN